MRTAKYDELDKYKYIKPISFRSKNEDVIDYLENFSSRKKILKNLKSFLEIDGNFDFVADIEQLDSADSYYRCFVEDLDGVSYVFYLFNYDSSQYGLIEKDGGLLYDLKLLKNSYLNYDNIDICKTGEVLDFKFGRFITDNKTFISVFLADDVCYQLLFNSENMIDTKPILERLNKVDGELSFKDFSDIVGEYTSGLELISFKIYKNFETVGIIDFNEEEKEEEKTKGLVKTIGKNDK